MALVKHPDVYGQHFKTTLLGLLDCISELWLRSHYTSTDEAATLAHKIA